MDPLSDDEVEEQDSPEQRVRRLETRLAEETQRLERLYEAYRKAEGDIADKQALIEVLAVSYTHLTLQTILLV